MRTDILRTVKHAIVVTPTETRSIATQLALFGTPEFEIKCSDGSVIKFNSPDDLIGFENYSYRRIVSLSMWAIGNASRARVDIGDQSLFLPETANILVSSDNDAIAADMANKLEAMVREFRPSFSPIARYDGHLLTIASWAALIVLAALYDVVVEPSPSPTPSGLRTSHVVLSVSMITLAGLALARAHRFLFPRIQFSFGKGAERVKQVDAVRSLLIVGIIGALILGLATNAIYDRLKSI